MMQFLYISITLFAALSTSSYSFSTNSSKEMNNNNKMNDPSVKIASDSGKIFESNGFSIRIPDDWNFDVMGPFQDSLGRTHSNSHLQTYTFDNSLTLAIYRYGYNIDIEQEIKAIMIDLNGDEDIYNLKKEVTDNSSFGDIQCKKITITYQYSDVEAMYINTIYLYDDAKNSFVINIDYAEDDIPKIKEALTLMNQTFSVSPFE